MTSPLKPSEMKCLTWVQFHPDFQDEKWNTGRIPFLLTDIYLLEKKKKKERWAVSYLCSDAHCRRCNGNPKGHVLIVKQNGEHTSPHVVIEETKKRTILHELSNPVFTEYDPTP